MPNRWKPNVTVAAVIERDGRYLLVEEQTSQGLRLNNPAGHLDPGETLVQACCRETLEETGHRFAPTALVGVYLSGPGTTPTGSPERARLSYLRFAFCGDLGAQEPGRALDQGIVRILWMDVDEIRASRARHRTPVVLRCIEDHIAGARFPLELLDSDLGACSRAA